MAQTHARQCSCVWILVGAEHVIIFGKLFIFVWRLPFAFLLKMTSNTLWLTYLCKSLCRLIEACERASSFEHCTQHVVFVMFFTLFTRRMRHATVTIIIINEYWIVIWTMTFAESICINCCYELEMENIYFYDDVRVIAHPPGKCLLVSKAKHTRCN